MPATQQQEFSMKIRQIIKIINNYKKISFNFGPTLLSWIAEKTPEVYQAILQADKDSQHQFEGYGNAIAQTYNHMIIPLANYQDKQTQIIWGIRDFFYRFKRKPEGMWLPETAVDLETLAIMAEHGIKFTLLAQHQAKRIRKIGNNHWQETEREKIDPTMPYLLNIKNRSIVIFFYDGPVSQAVAFSSLLNKGENLAERIKNIFSDKRDFPQLAHIATDGETYGHHHPHGDMALAYALEYIEKNNFAQLTNYAQFLNKFPPTHEVEIIENTSWSCIHGVERWKSSCGCNTGQNKTWNQDWRAPLRQAFDWLRDTLAPVYEEKAAEFFHNPMDARNNYINVVLDRSEKSLQNFFEQNATHRLNSREQTTALTLLEMQRHAMLMYTSCGWFFDELSGIETVQVMTYAARAAQLAEKFFADSVEKELLEKLAIAKSNLKQYQDGYHIYQNLVKPCLLDWGRIGAHFSISSLFENYEKKTKIYCYEVSTENRIQKTTGQARLGIGYSQFKSIITTETVTLAYAAIHFGDQNISCGVEEFSKEIEYHQAVNEISKTFDEGDLVKVNNLIKQYFSDSSYSINSLFRDEQRKILHLVLSDTLKELEDIYLQLYQRHGILIRFIETLHIPLPESFRMVAEHVIKSELRESFKKQKFKQINLLLNEAGRGKIKLDKNLKFSIQKSLETMMKNLHDQPSSLTQLDNLNKAMQICNHLPFQINLNHIQNKYYDLLHNYYPKIKQQYTQGDDSTKEWLEKFISLGNQLMVAVL